MHNEFNFFTEVHQALSCAHTDSHDPEQRAHLQILIKEAWERAKAETHRPPLVFKSAPHGREWFIGVEGNEKSFRSDLRGLSAAHLAIQHGANSTVRTADFAEPGAKYPDTVVRKAIRKNASEWLIRNGNQDLATVFLGIKVEAGIVQYTPHRHSPKIITL